MRSKKSLCTYNGPLILGSPFKIPFFPRGKFLVVLGGWVGGLAWGGGAPDQPPPPPVDRHILVGSGRSPSPPSHKVGRESVGLHNAHSERLHGGYHWQEVPLYVLDEHVQQYLLPRIDVLSIDTEGNDPLVLEGGVQTLSTMVRYVEFEYHNIGAWLSVELKDVLEQLEKMGFVCYWLGKAKLWRITGCWHQDYAVRQWSNIGCVHVTNTEWYATMEDIFKATVPQ